MTQVSVLPGLIPGRPSGAQQLFAQTTVTRQIAPVTGKDTNSGVPGSPWKTWRRYLDYVGPAFIDSGAVHQIFYTEDAPASDPIILPNVGSTGNLVVAADPSAIMTVHMGAFDNVQVNSPAGNLAYEVTNGALNWTPFVQLRILDVTASRFAWILSDQGGGTARVSIPTINFAIADSYVVQLLPKIGAICFDGSQVVAGGGITFNDLIFDTGAVVPQLGTITPSGTSAVSFNGCHLGGATGIPMQGTYNAFECMIVDPQWNAALPVLDHVGILGTGGLVGIFGGTFVIMADCISQSASFEVFAGLLAAVTDVGIFDAAFDGIAVDVGGKVQASAGLYGAGNGGFGALVRTGGNAVTWQGAAPTITGSSGDASVGGAAVAWGAAPIDTFGAVIAQSL